MTDGSIVGDSQETADVPPLSQITKLKREALGCIDQEFPQWSTFEPGEAPTPLEMVELINAIERSLDIIGGLCRWLEHKGFDGSTHEKALPGEYDSARDLIARIRGDKEG